MNKINEARRQRARDYLAGWGPTPADRERVVDMLVCFADVEDLLKIRQERDPGEDELEWMGAASDKPY